jgi:hypothetical protein
MTSIEWLEEKAKEFAIDLDLLNYFEQAKEMHKQEIIDAWKMGRYDSDKIVMTEKFYAEQYYQETFVSKGSDAKDVVLGYISLDAQMLDTQLPQQ